MPKNLLQKTLAVIVFAPILFIAIFPGTFRTLVDSVAYPWAHPWSGKPTLTGRWQGDLKIGNQDYPVTLDLERKPLVSHRRGTRGKYPQRGGFTGTAQWTDHRGQDHRYDLTGRSNRAGSEISMHLTATARPSSPEPQPTLQQLLGAWDGTTLVLTGETTFGIFDGTSETYPADSPTLPVTVTLKHP